MTIINNKYCILEKIGSGSFGSIYKGENNRTKEEVAIKIESICNGTKLLKNESIIYQYLQSTQKPIINGIPKVKWFGKDEINYYMVIDLLGHSLQSLKNRYNVFSLTLTLKIGIQIIKLLQAIHNKGLVHRDIKPDNFLFGLKERTQLYIIDFGFCKSLYINDKHISLTKTNGIVGSFTYASLNAHQYFEQSRRDDLESLGYMLIYFILGSLSWQSCCDESITTKNNNIMILKKQIIENNKVPIVFLEYLKYVTNLSFEERPNYDYLIQLFKNYIEK